MSRPMIAAVFGVMLAAFAQFLSIGLSGAGHGWVEPFFFGAAMWITLPLMAVRLSQNAAGSHAFDWLVLILGLVLDGLLVITTLGSGGRIFPMFGTGVETFLKVVTLRPPLVVLWIALWLSWQIAAVFLLISQARHPSRT